MQTMVETKCTKCGGVCVLGVNAITTHAGDVCEDCSGVKRGFAGGLLVEDRRELVNSLKQSLSECAMNPNLSSLYLSALRDAEEVM